MSSEGREFGGIALAYNTRTREEADRVLAEAVRAGATLLKPAHDHRALDGARGAQFLDALADFIEEPLALLV